MSKKRVNFKYILFLIIPIITFISSPVGVKAFDSIEYDCGYSKSSPPPCVNNNTCILLCGYNLKYVSLMDGYIFVDKVFYKSMYLYYMPDNQALKIAISKPGANNTCVLEEIDALDAQNTWYENSRVLMMNEGKCPVVLDERNVENKKFCFETDGDKKRCNSSPLAGAWIQDSYTQEYDISEHPDKFKEFQKKYKGDNETGTEHYDTCEDLIGPNLKKKINEVMNIIKVAIPILLIAFGILDFGKALLAQDENNMKKAQTTFIRRLIIAVIIFLVPTFVNLLIDLANTVWPSISGETCL